MSRFALLALLDSLETRREEAALAAARQRVGRLLRSHELFRPGPRFQKKLRRRFPAAARTRPASGTSGPTPALFSRLAAERGIPTVALDIDAAAVEKNYLPVPPGRGTNSCCRWSVTSPTPARASAGRTASGCRCWSAARPISSWPWPWCITWPSPTTCPWPGSPVFSAGSCRSLVIEFIPKERFPGAAPAGHPRGHLPRLQRCWF